MSKLVSDPLVSVLLPVYNAEQYISTAVSSLLSQTYKNVELIIINDGSTDNSFKVLSSFTDPRIVLVSRENKGLISTLNECISLANGKFIARMDADDVCMPDRIEKQLNYLLNNPEVGVVGCSVERIDKYGRHMYDELMPGSDFFMKALLFYRSPFYHPAVMVNLKSLKTAFYYDQEFMHAEDYELWVRLAKTTKFGSLRQKLLKYRVLESGISISNSSTVLGNKLSAVGAHFFNKRLTDRQKLIYEKRELISSLVLILKSNQKKHIILLFCYLALSKIKSVCFWREK